MYLNSRMAKKFIVRKILKKHVDYVETMDYVVQIVNISTIHFFQIQMEELIQIKNYSDRLTKKYTNNYADKEYTAI